MDKIHVAKNFIIPEILSNLNISPEFVSISDDVLGFIIDAYTYEAGARKLKEKLYEIFRDVNLLYLTHLSDYPFEITLDFILKSLDPSEKITLKTIHSEPSVGIMNGLYATTSGVGGIIPIQACKIFSNSHLELHLTGQQGDVMKESMTVAKSLALSILNSELAKEIVNESSKYSIHIHCPEGGTPKDGPSAGTAITICLLSVFTGLKIKNDLAITGEIDLYGNVLPIGGLESKSDGAKMAGITTVLCPSKNIDDLNKIRSRPHPPESETFSIIPIYSIKEAIQYSLLLPENKSWNDYFSISI
jgi:ATP-dependent Lon protease